MSTLNQPEKQHLLDQFIKEIEKREKKHRRRKRQMTLVSFAVVCGVTTLFWQMYEHTTQSLESFRSYDASQLNPDMVRRLFTESEERVIVYFPGSDRADTIANIAEYITLDRLGKRSLQSNSSVVMAENIGDEEWEYNSSNSKEVPVNDFPRETRSEIDNSEDERYIETAGLNEPVADTPEPSLSEISSSQQNTDENSSDLNESSTEPGTFSGEAPPPGLLATNSIANISSSNSLETTTRALDSALKPAPPAIKPIEEKSVKPILVTPEKNPPTTAPNNSSVKIIKPREIAEVMPSFPGGTIALQRFLDGRLKYPSEARQYEIEGKVYIRFVVNPDGSLSNFKMLRGVGYGCDEEAMRIARLMPNGIQACKPVIGFQ